MENDKLQVSAQPEKVQIYPTLPDASLVNLYRQELDNLRECLTADAGTRAKATHHLRTLISKVEIHPLPAKGAARLKITGDLCAVVGLTDRAQKTAVSMVAEEGLEPPTPGL